MQQVIFAQFLFWQQHLQLERGGGGPGGGSLLEPNPAAIDFCARHGLGGPQLLARLSAKNEDDVEGDISTHFPVICILGAWRGLAPRRVR